MRLPIRISALIFLFVFVACRYPGHVTRDPGQVVDSKESRTSSTGGVIGVASWYGHPYHGRRTANGEVYDMNLLTAAHRIWPFNTLVLVTHLGNNRTVLVRINDRGPFIEGREIDLSREAARRLDMIDEGTSRVLLQRLDGVFSQEEQVLAVAVPEQSQASQPSISETKVRYRLQMGAFSSEKNARRLLNQLASGLESVSVQVVGDGRLFRVQSRDCFDETRAEAIRAQLHELGFESILRECD